MTIDACPVCRSKQRETVLTVENFPYFTAPVAKKDKADILRKYGIDQLGGRLSAVVCQECGHVYLDTSAPQEVLEDLYGRYYTYPSALQGSFIPERDDAFIHIFKRGVRVFRI